MIASVENKELPNPFLFNDGSALTRVEDWRKRRREILDLIVDLEYGGMPPVPTATHGELLHSHVQRKHNGSLFQTIRVTSQSETPFPFILQLTIPPGEGPFPIVINGDACWNFVTPEVIAEALKRNYIIAQFNRMELAPDVYNSERTSGLYPIYPDHSFGALSAWAWGYHRCVDVLEQMDCVDASQIAISGHSRGGKTVLLAGATDERIALTNPNNSGAGGAGCYRVQGPESETLADLIRAIPYWFGPELKSYVGRENELPFDQHFLKALLAPRALLTTEALGDHWCNLPGTWQTHLAAQEVYRFLGAEQNIGIVFREGGHEHNLTDWRVMFDFADSQFRGTKATNQLDQNPFLEMKRSYSWRAPS
ncbi:MAG: hypothetical protein CMI16_04580 [Opitutaceae bacterium]|nr:hypothetical protein [Opitutaceae bacterium]|tara:strand:+ start:1483 stop:2580 length:1098 start_codon:yes stop_codon:yes gene_type:complete